MSGRMEEFQRRQEEPSGPTERFWWVGPVALVLGTLWFFDSCVDDTPSVSDPNAPACCEDDFHVP